MSAFLANLPPTKIEGFLVDPRHVLTEIPDDYTVAEHESRLFTG
jgi:hypothetical protein